MLEPRWRPVQGHLGDNPFDSAGVGWSKSHYSPATTPWPHHHALRQSRYSDDGIMDQDVDGDGAINLSTSQRPSAATTPNDGIQSEDVEQQAASLEKVLKEQQQQQQLELERAWDQQERDAKGNGSTSPGSDAAARHHDHSPPPPSSTVLTAEQKAAIPVSQAQVGSHPPMMSSPVSGLHHMQQLLQQHVLNPSQLQNLMKQHSLLQQQQHQHQLAEIGKKQMEATIQQLQEQLQLNLIQQTHILQSGDKKKAPGSLQQLSIQQQQLIQQLQLMQRQYVVHQGMGMQPLMLPQPGLGSRDVLSPWKESSDRDRDRERDHQNHKDMNGLLGALTPGRSSRDESIIDEKPDRASSNTPDRVHHLYGHGVCKWPGCEAICDDLPTFMKHLNTEHILDDRSTAQARVQMQVVSQLELQLQKERDRLQAMMHHLHLAKQLGTPEPGDLTAPGAGVGGGGSTPSSKPSSQPPPVSLGSLVTAVRSPVLHQHQSNVAGPIRRRISDKSALSLAGEIQRNREFYKNADVRPPFTYASLIRQSIIESPDKQLTLNEIYNWFQNTFCYFRRNAATWKNAVRHNLSLHKCFMRVENVKGAVWTVDEVEFYKRRPQRCSSGPLAQPVVGGASKSPTMNHSPPMYGESLPSNLQAPLLEESLAFLSSAANMGRQRERSESPNHDLLRSPMNGGLHIKQESLMPDHPHHPQHLGQQPHAPLHHHHLEREVAPPVAPPPPHHVIKRELHHDYDDMEAVDAHDGIAEDLTVGQEPPHADGEA